MAKQQTKAAAKAEGAGRVRLADITPLEREALVTEVIKAALVWVIERMPVETRRAFTDRVMKAVAQMQNGTAATRHKAVPR